MVALPPASLPKGATRVTVDALGSQIVTGRWEPGAKLPHEQELAAMFGVGRNVLREAVKVLGGKGLIITARRYGSRVRKKSEWNFFDTDVLSWRLSDQDGYARFLRDLTELRLCIEPRAAMLAAIHATSEERGAACRAHGCAREGRHAGSRRNRRRVPSGHPGGDPQRADGRVLRAVPGAASRPLRRVAHLALGQVCL